MTSQPPRRGRIEFDNVASLCPRLSKSECVDALEVAGKSLSDTLIDRFCGELNTMVTTYLLNFLMCQLDESPATKYQRTEKIVKTTSKLIDLLEIEPENLQSRYLWPLSDQVVDSGLDEESMQEFVAELLRFRDVGTLALNHQRIATEKAKQRRTKRHRGNPELDELFSQLNLIWAQKFYELPGISQTDGVMGGPYFRFVSFIFGVLDSKCSAEINYLLPSFQDSLRMTPAKIRTRFRNTGISKLR